MFTCVSVRHNPVATSNRFGRERYLFSLNCFSNSSSCWLVNAVLGLLVLPSNVCCGPPTNKNERWEKSKTSRGVEKCWNDVGFKCKTQTKSEGFCLICLNIVLLKYVIWIVKMFRNLLSVIFDTQGMKYAPEKISALEKFK